MGTLIIQSKCLQRLKRVLKSLWLGKGLGFHTIKATLKVHCRLWCFVPEQKHTLRSRDSFVALLCSNPLKFLIIICLMAGSIIIFSAFQEQPFRRVLQRNLKAIWSEKGRNFFFIFLRNFFEICLL